MIVASGPDLRAAIFVIKKIFCNKKLKKGSKVDRVFRFSTKYDFENARGRKLKITLFFSR